MIVCCDKQNLALARVSALTARERCLSCLVMGPEMEVASLPPDTHFVGYFSVNELLVRSRDGRNCTLVEEFSFTRPSGERIVYPAGSTTDGASSPAAAWSFGCPPFGIYWLAAVGHDITYRGKSQPPFLDRATADLVFVEGMEALGTPRLLREAMYRAVRSSEGQLAWEQGHGVPDEV